MTSFTIESGDETYTFTHYELIGWWNVSHPIERLYQHYFEDDIEFVSFVTKRSVTLPFNTVHPIISMEWELKCCQDDGTDTLPISNDNFTEVVSYDSFAHIIPFDPSQHDCCYTITNNTKTVEPHIIIEEVITVMREKGTNNLFELVKHM
jgi:hypothetical protein